VPVAHVGSAAPAVSPCRFCTSIGGARPKNVVETEEGLWIAKFPEKGDRWNNTRVEASMLALARECGLRACDTRAAEVAGADVLLVRRFDRVKIPGGTAS
jgi:serine/threonine-protein kinase HipA